MRKIFVVGFIFACTHLGAALIDDVKIEIKNLETNYQSVVKHEGIESVKDTVRIKNFTVMLNNPLTIAFKVQGDLVVSQKSDETTFATEGPANIFSTTFTSPLTLTLKTKEGKLFPLSQDNILSILSGIAFNMGKGTTSFIDDSNGKATKLFTCDAIKFQFDKTKNSENRLAGKFDWDLKNLTFFDLPPEFLANHRIESADEIFGALSLYGVINSSATGTFMLPSNYDFTLANMLQEAARQGYEIKINSLKNSTNFGQAEVQCSLYGAMKNNVPHVVFESESKYSFTEAQTNYYKEAMVANFEETYATENPEIAELVQSKRKEIANLFPNFHKLGKFTSIFNISASFNQEGTAKTIQFLADTSAEKLPYSFLLEGIVVNPYNQSELEMKAFLKVTNYDKFVDDVVAFYNGAIEIGKSKYDGIEAYKIESDRLLKLKKSVLLLANEPVKNGKDFETYIELSNENGFTFGNKPLQEVVFPFMNIFMQ